MNGKRAKFLRKSAAFLNDNPNNYVEVHHRKKGMFPELDKDGKIVEMIEKEYIAIQIRLKECTRSFYQLMKRLPRKAWGE